jgi:GNAT superfamily N-acetyltransferase
MPDVLREREQEQEASAVIGSDRCYFALGAELHPIPGGATYHLGGLHGVGAATVTWVDHPTEVREPRGWVVEVSDRVAHLGAAEVRVYGAGPNGTLAGALTDAGFTARGELIFSGHPPEAARPVELVPVDDPAVQAERRSLFEGIEVGPDGHAADVDGWCAAEDRRAATGGLRLFVARLGATPVGVVGMIDAGPVLRMKNLLVGAGHRRRGIGAAIVAAVGAHPIAGGRPVGMIALAGEPGEAMYRKMGLPVVGTLVEWSRPVAAR